MSFWHHLTGRICFVRGKALGIAIAQDKRLLGNFELAYVVDRYDTKGAVQYLKGFALGYSLTIRQQHSGKKLSSIVVREPYLLGQSIADGVKTLPKKTMAVFVRGQPPLQAKNALRLLTDGYNTRIRELQKKNSFIKYINQQTMEKSPPKDDKTPQKETATPQGQDKKPDNSPAYKLGYASAINNSKIGYKLYDHVQSKDSRDEMLQVVLDYGKGVDHARERMAKDSPEKQNPQPEKNR